MSNSQKWKEFNVVPVYVAVHKEPVVWWQVKQLQRRLQLVGNTNACWFVSLDSCWRVVRTTDVGFHPDCYSSLQYENIRTHSGKINVLLVVLCILNYWLIMFVASIMLSSVESLHLKLVGRTMKRKKFCVARLTLSRIAPNLF